MEIGSFSEDNLTISNSHPCLNIAYDLKERGLSTLVTYVFLKVGKCGHSKKKNYNYPPFDLIKQI